MYWHKVLFNDFIRKISFKKPEIDIDLYKKTFENNKSQKATINLKNVSKIYSDGIKAVNNISLDIKEGEFYVLLGPSGCGKTTTLRMLAGLELISDGELYIKSLFANATPPMQRDIAMVFQSYALYNFMTVYKNVEFGIRNKVKNNPIYNNIMEQLKDANNNNRSKISEVIAEKNILKKGSSSSLSELRILKRKTKVAKIQKDYVKFTKYKNLILYKKLEIKHGENFEIAKEIRNLEFILKNNGLEEVIKIKNDIYSYKNKIRKLKNTIIPEEFEIQNLLEQYYSEKVAKNFDYAKKIEKKIVLLKDNLKNKKNDISKEIAETKKIIYENKKEISKVKNNKLKSSKNVERQEKISIQLKELRDKLNDNPNKIAIKKLNQKLRKLKYSKNSNSDLVNKLLLDRRNAMDIWQYSIKDRINEITKMLGIHMYLQRKPSELSGGQRQRVALARAISKRTNLFLFDEPLSNLDAKLRARMRIEIRALHDQIEATSVYVTHDQIEAMSMADKIVVMHKGFIQQVGTPLELINKPFNLFVAQFVGNTNINIFNATANNGVLNINKKIKLELNLPKLKAEKLQNIKEDVYFAIRPEHIISNPKLLSSRKDVFSGKLLKTEILGNEAVFVVFCNKLDSEISIVKPSQEISNYKIGSTIDFAFKDDLVGLFSKKDGYSLLEEFSNENLNAKDNWISGIKDRKWNSFLLHSQKIDIPISKKMNLNIRSLFSNKAKREKAYLKTIPDYEDDIIAKL